MEEKTTRKFVGDLKLTDSYNVDEFLESLSCLPLLDSLEASQFDIIVTLNQIINAAKKALEQ